MINAIWLAPWALGAAACMIGGVDLLFFARPRPLLTDVPQVLVVGAVFTLLAVRAHRRGVEMCADGLTVRRLFRTRHFPWEAIERFSLEDTPGDDGCPPGMFLEMVLWEKGKYGEGMVRLPLGGGFLFSDGDAGRARRLRILAEELNGDLRRHTGPTEQSPHDP